jgi:hypothetical protein
MRQKGFDIRRANFRLISNVVKLGITPNPL